MSEETFSPRWAKHVTGTFEKKVDEDGHPEKILVYLACERCGDRATVPCHQGAPRSKVQAYAASHVHADVMAVQRHDPRR